MFVKQYGARLRVGHYPDPGIMRRVGLGAAPAQPVGTDVASVQAWITAVFQDVYGRPPSAAELSDDTQMVMGGMPGIPSPWTVWSYYKQLLPQVRSGYLQRVTAGDFVKPSNGEHVGPFALAPLAAATTTSTTTPTPTPPPPPALAGGDQAQITQLIVPASAVAVAAQFQVTATVLNAGPAPWGSGYTVQLAAPAGTPTQSSVAFATLPSALAPGQQADVVLTVWAPTVPGTYPYQYAVLNAAGQAISVTGTLTISVVPASAVAPAGTVTTPTGFVSREEFDAYVQAALQQQQNTQGSVSAMEQANVRGYQPTYMGLPGAPPPVPLPPSVVVQAPASGTDWWAWGSGILIAGALAWYFSKGKAKSSRGSRTRVVKTTTRHGGGGT